MIVHVQDQRPSCGSPAALPLTSSCASTMLHVLTAPERVKILSLLDWHSQADCCHKLTPWGKGCMTPWGMTPWGHDALGQGPWGMTPWGKGCLGSSGRDRCTSSSIDCVQRCE
eukprot:CAMPEP_0174703952 /NCGR_PEP_ID=MMETSP1094-20130205/7721_1 /TAXON_ID=156173 /ORGANISM="Chrysochromulina brevifilum, Strain UTEX LB 985" /LENGTH=112 /DNA_ID=CAMNT_0015901945 /DNA_START=166 /DNA_END=505 /DNA_ORIENTATION=+